MTTQQLLDQLVEEGGAIIASNDCSEMEIADAKAHGRFSHIGAFGIVRRTKEWLDLQKSREQAHPYTDGRYLKLGRGLGTKIKFR